MRKKICNNMKRGETVNREYYIIRKKYLALALGYLGFQYFKVNDEKGEVMYSFENNLQFRKALGELLQLKKEVGVYNTYYKTK